MSARELLFTNPPDPDDYPFNCAPGFAPHGVMDWQVPEPTDGAALPTDAQVDAMIREVSAAIRTAGPRVEDIGAANGAR